MLTPVIIKPAKPREKMTKVPIGLRHPPPQSLPFTLVSVCKVWKNHLTFSDS